MPAKKWAAADSQTRSGENEALFRVRKISYAGEKNVYLKSMLYRQNKNKCKKQQEIFG